jgi:5'-nucleotidase
MCVPLFQTESDLVRSISLRRIGLKGFSMFAKRNFWVRGSSFSVSLMVALLGLVAAAAQFGSSQPRAVQGSAECPVRVTLLQVNDVYQFSPVDGGTRGGLARVLTLRKQIMAQSPHALYLLAGDTISPSVESNTYYGSQMIDAWNASGLDYATFGNHEFDFGPDVLRQRMHESHFKWLAANVIDKQTGKPFGDTPEFEIREFEGVKVGIIGIVLQETLATSRPGTNVDILDPCETAGRVIPKIRAAGARVIVALTHQTLADDKKFARCSGVDVVVGGHEHTLLQSMSGHAPIFKMTADARELGRIDLNISKSTGEIESIDWEIIPVTDKVKPDPSFAAIDRKYGAMLRSLSVPVGRTAVELDARSANVRSVETNVADFIADTFRRATAADVTIVNGGSVRADQTFPAGVLTKRNVLSMLPFNNRVVKIEVTGAQMRAALENGLSTVAEEVQPGRFPQVSGIRYVFDASHPPGSRLTSVTVNGKPLDDQKIYTLATTSYLAVEGGDGYQMLRNLKFLIRPEQNFSESDLLLRAISSQRAIAPKIDGRIKRMDKSTDPNSCNRSAG